MQQGDKPQGIKMADMNTKSAIKIHVILISPLWNTKDFQRSHAFEQIFIYLPPPPSILFTENY